MEPEFRIQNSEVYKQIFISINWHRKHKAFSKQDRELHGFRSKFRRKQKTEKSVSVSFLIQECLPRKSAAHGGLGTTTSTTKKDNLLQAWPEANLI